jgi:hypothetical protein
MPVLSPQQDGDASPNLESRNLRYNFHASVFSRPDFRPRIFAYGSPHPAGPPLYDSVVSTGTYLGGQRPLAALALRKLDGAEGIPHNRVNSHQSLVGTPILSRFLSQSPSHGSEQAINLSEILLRNNFNLRLRRPKTSSGISLNNSLEVQ